MKILYKKNSFFLTIIKVFYFFEGCVFNEYDFYLTLESQSYGVDSKKYKFCIIFMLEFLIFSLFYEKKLIFCSSNVFYIYKKFLWLVDSKIWSRLEGCLYRKDWSNSCLNAVPPLSARSENIAFMEGELEHPLR